MTKWPTRMDTLYIKEHSGEGRVISENKILLKPQHQHQHAKNE